MKDAEVIRGTITEEVSPPQFYLVIETVAGKRKVYEDDIRDILRAGDFGRATRLLQPLIDDAGLTGLPPRHRWKITGERYARASYAERSIWIAFGVLVAGTANYLALYKREDSLSSSTSEIESEGKRDVKVALAGGAAAVLCPLVAYSFPASPGLAARQIISGEGEEAMAHFRPGYRRKFGVKRAKHAAMGALVSCLVAVIYYGER